MKRNWIQFGLAIYSRKARWHSCLAVLEQIRHLIRFLILWDVLRKLLPWIFCRLQQRKYFSLSFSKRSLLWVGNRELFRPVAYNYRNAWQRRQEVRTILPHCLFSFCIPSSPLSHLFTFSLIFLPFFLFSFSFSFSYSNYSWSRITTLGYSGSGFLFKVLIPLIIRKCFRCVWYTIGPGPRASFNNPPEENETRIIIVHSV